MSLFLRLYFVFFSRKTPKYLLSAMQKVIDGKVTPLELSVDIRWGTVSRLIVAIIDGKNAIRSVLYDPRIIDNEKLGPDSELFRNNLYRDDDFWIKLVELKSLILPFADAIEKIEGM
jgi:hypothetical protein